MDFNQIWLLITKLVNYIFSGGMNGIAALLILIIIGLIYDRIRLIKEIDEKDEKIEQVIGDYYKGTITISEAFNSLKLVLIEMKSKL